MSSQDAPSGAEPPWHAELPAAAMVHPFANLTAIRKDGQRPYVTEGSTDLVRLTHVPYAE